MKGMSLYSGPCTYNRANNGILGYEKGSKGKRHYPAYIPVRSEYLFVSLAADATGFVISHTEGDPLFR